MNRVRLRRQINRCNHLLNKNKGQYYQELVKEKSYGKKLWRALSKVLGRSQVSKLPSCTDEKSLANQFDSFL